MKSGGFVITKSLFNGIMELKWYRDGGDVTNKEKDKRTEIIKRPPLGHFTHCCGEVRGGPVIYIIL